MGNSVNPLHQFESQYQQNWHNFVAEYFKLNHFLFLNKENVLYGTMRGIQKPVLDCNVDKQTA
jgi:hypothetical protein